MKQISKGVILNYRRGPKSQKNYEYLIKFDSCNSRKDAIALIGRKVLWNKNITGKIIAPHGNKGVVRVRFKKGLPGQALGTFVLLL